jgi:hypothetical protein
VLSLTGHPASWLARVLAKALLEKGVLEKGVAGRLMRASPYRDLPVCAPAIERRRHCG